MHMRYIISEQELQKLVIDQLQREIPGLSLLYANVRIEVENSEGEWGVAPVRVVAEKERSL